jgi:VWFA-related protein
MTMNRRFILLASALLLVSSQAFAAHREVATVEVVQIPVYISHDGRAVTGLTKNDFELYVNGERQTVDYFDTIDFAGLPAEAASDPRQRRLYLLTFDMRFSSRAALQRAQKAAEQYVDHAVSGDVFAVATYTANHSLQFVVPFTRDQALLHRALRGLGSARAGDPLFLTVRTDGGSMAGPDGPATQAFGFMRDLALQPLRAAAEDEIRALSHLADRMAVLEGQKHVVLLSGGFDAEPIHGVPAARPGNGYGTYFMLSNPTGYGTFSMLHDAAGNMFGTPSGNNTFSEFSTFSTPYPAVQGNPQLGSDPRLGRYLEQMYGHFTAASVFLDAIDIEGLRPGQRVVDTEGLFALTRDTGGTLVERTSNLNQAIQELTDKQRVVYVLGFRPTSGRKTNGIRVEVRNAPSGARVRYRPSYSNEISLPASNDALRLADVLMNDLPQTGLSLRAAVTATEKRAVVDVDIATRELLALSDSQDIEAEALIYVYSGNAVVAFKQRRITIESARVDPAKSVRLSEQFDLPDGHYAAKVLVRFGDQIGFVRSDFVVGQ